TRLVALTGNLMRLAAVGQIGGHRGTQPRRVWRKPNRCGFHGRSCGPTRRHCFLTVQTKSASLPTRSVTILTAGARVSSNSEFVLSPTPGGHGACTRND